MVQKTADPPWRAVANPTRRRLIELLRDGPRRTGDLCRAFSTTRFAVMKHLAVLERAGLVAVRRQGRERWNVLNPEPLRQLESHWPQATSSAGSSLAPRSSLLDPGSSSPCPERAQRVEGSPLAPFSIHEDCFLDASPGRVFDALTFSIAGWWGAPYLLSPDSTGLVVEPQLGGRFYEEWGHRQGIIRGTVTAIRQDERLELTGAISGSGSLPSTLKLRLERREGGTLLRFEHAGLAASRADEAALRVMWDDLLRARLKAYVER